MKGVLKHLIVGVILCVVIFVVLVVFVNTNAEGAEGKLSFLEWLPLGFLVILFGTVGYTLVKIWSDWFSRHFVVFTKNPIQYAVTKFIIDPLIGVVGFNILGFYLLNKMSWFNFLDKILSK
jgi:hypothetical protein